MIIVRYKRVNETIGNIIISGNFLFLPIESCVMPLSLGAISTLLERVDNNSGDTYLSPNINKAYVIRGTDILPTSSAPMPAEESQCNTTSVIIMKGTNVFRLVQKPKAVLLEDSLATVRRLIINRDIHVD